MIIMKYTIGFIMSLFMISVAGCATLPQGPSVVVLPTQGKPYSQFQGEDANCRKSAEQSVGISPAEIQNQNTASGAGVGALTGAAVGGLLGSASGNMGAGAAIGAGVGLLTGAAVGSDSGRVSGREAQRRYDIAYAQCMASYGNQVVNQARPARVYHQRRRVIVVPAEPPPVYYAPPPVYYQPAPPLYPPPGTPPPTSGSTFTPPPPVYSTNPGDGAVQVPPADAYYPPPNTPPPGK